jgi:hypothetical protein
MYEIKKYNPCKESIEFRSKYDSFKNTWNNCPRGDWMLWIARKLNINHQLLTLAKAYCAKTVYHLMTDEKSKNAIIVAINYGNNLATKEELQIAAANAAAYAADAAADAAYADAAADAAYAAAAAADAAADADAAAYAAYAAADAAYADAAYADAAAIYTVKEQAKIKNRKKTANICRKYLTIEVFKALNIT